MAKTRQAPVVAGVDGSAVAAQAVRWAAHDADLRGTTLMLVTVDTVTTSAEPLGGPVSRSLYDSVRAERKRILAEAAKDARSLAPGIAVDAQIRTGEAAAALIQQSRSAQLVVVGTRGHGEFTGLLVGSVSQALVACARSSVLVVGQHELDTSTAREGSVVIGVDGSVSSDRALQEGFAEASMRQAMIKAVHSPNARDAMTNTKNDDGAWRAKAQEFLVEQLKPWQARYPEVPVRHLVGEQSPAKSLAHYGAEAQMVVVGSRGRGGITGLLLGSVSRTLLHTAWRPVMIVR